MFGKNANNKGAEEISERKIKILAFGLIVIIIAIAVVSMAYKDMIEVQPSISENEDLHKIPALPPIKVNEVSLKEAENIFGTLIPTPKYIPGDYRLQRVFVIGDNLAYFLYSDKEISDEKVEEVSDLANILSKMPQGATNGPKVVLVVEKVDKKPSKDFAETLAKKQGNKVLDLDGVKKAMWTERQTTHLIDWWSYGFHFQLGGYKPELAIEELTKCAESVKMEVV